MPKTIRFSTKRKAEVEHQLEIIHVNLQSVWTEIITGQKEPFSIPLKERVFNAEVATETIQKAFGKKVV